MGSHTHLCVRLTCTHIRGICFGHPDLRFHSFTRSLFFATQTQMYGLTLHLLFSHERTKCLPALGSHDGFTPQNGHGFGVVCGSSFMLTSSGMERTHNSTNSRQSFPNRHASCIRPLGLLGAGKTHDKTNIRLSTASFESWPVLQMKFIVSMPIKKFD
jgi:hypothetical protein